MATSRTTNSNRQKNTPKRQTSTTKKGTTTKKTTTQTRAKKTNSKKAPTKEEREKLAKLQYEIVVITVFVLAVLLMLMVYFNIGGAIGNWVKDSLFGIFGFGANLVPIYLLVGAFFKIFNRNSNRLTNKLILSFVLIMVVSSMSHVHYIHDSQIEKVFYEGESYEKSAFFPILVNYYQLSAMHHFGGGFVGGLIGDLMVIALDRVGAFIILGLMVISLVILISEQSLFEVLKFMWAGMKGIGHKILQWYGNVKAARAEHLARMEAEKAQVPKSKPKVKKEKPHKVKNTKSRDHDVFSQIRDAEIQEKERAFNVYSLEKEADASQVEEPVIEGDMIIGDLVNMESDPNIEIDTFPDDSTDRDVESFDETLKPHNTKSQIKDEILDSKPEKPVQISFFKDNKEKKKDNIPDVNTMVSIEEEMGVKDEKFNPTMYEFPPMELLKQNHGGDLKGNKSGIQKNVAKLQETLENFGVNAKVVNVSCGPTVTRYEIKPEIGVKVNKIVNLADDIALHLAAVGIRIEAPIPGKPLVGIEVPNTETSSVFLRDVLDTDIFRKKTSKVSFALGKDIGGEAIIGDISTMPHMLICGATGAGKSVCVNSIIISLLYKAHPDEVKLIMIDPKVVELKIYNDIPHLLIPVVTDPKKAAGALVWATQEMHNRYKMFSDCNVRDIRGFNKAVEEHGDLKKMPQIIVIVDELADLMQVASKEVEDSIQQLSAMARAAGIYMILATQRPSVDVVTGIIKANIPSRIAFSVSSSIDSRTIIDTPGAEKLIGKGDMLYLPRELQKPIRVQGTFVSDTEIESVVNFLKATQKVHYDNEIIEKIATVETLDKKQSLEDGDDGDKQDDLMEDVIEYIISKEKASASMLQRRFRIGFSRAGRIIDQLEDDGIIGPAKGSKPRDVLINYQQFMALKQEATGETSEEADVSAEELMAQAPESQG